MNPSRSKCTRADIPQGRPSPLWAGLAASAVPRTAPAADVAAAAAAAMVQGVQWAADRVAVAAQAGKAVASDTEGLPNPIRDQCKEGPNDAPSHDTWPTPPPCPLSLHVCIQATPTTS
jgi:hypothetical protein